MIAGELLGDGDRGHRGQCGELGAGISVTKVDMTLDAKPVFELGSAPHVEILIATYLGLLDFVRR